MKKFLKVFIVVLLVVAVIAGTCYFFFKNKKEKDNTTASFADMLASESKASFNSSLIDMQNVVNSDGTDNRIDLLIATNEKLDKSLYILSTYYIHQNTQINEKQISTSLKNVNSSRSLLSSMMAEYNIKKTSSYFDRHLGANDFYNQMCCYFVNYANLINLMNHSINADKNADIKFSAIEIYANVVINTFSETNYEYSANTKVVVDDSSDIDIMNSKIDLNEFTKVGI